MPPLRADFFMNTFSDNAENGGLRPLFRMAPGLELALASASPRRRQFLAEWGLPFRVVRADAREPAPQPGEPPAAYTCRAAAAKAMAALQAMAQPQAAPDCGDEAARQVILAADTIVALDGDILGKPADAPHALRMLERLNGRGHEVISAVCLLLPVNIAPAAALTKTTPAIANAASPAAAEIVDGGPCGQLRQITFSDASRVFFHRWPRSVLQAYVTTGEPHDKAGAYAIQGQGAMLVDRVEGSWSTVVGLPVTRLAQQLLEMGVMLPISPE